MNPDVDISFHKAKRKSVFQKQKAGKCARTVMIDRTEVCALILI